MLRWIKRLTSVPARSDAIPKAEWIKTIVGFATSSVGFLLALLVNSLVERGRDKKTYCTMLRAIQAELNKCDVLVGIYAHRYGTDPEDRRYR